MSPHGTGKEQKNESIDRRGFLGTAAVAAAGLAGTACSGPGETGGEGPAVQTRPQVNWRLASSFPETLPALYGSSVVLADRVATLTDGRFRIQPYQAGELVGGLSVMDAAQQGSVHIGHTPAYYYTGKASVLAFDTGVPFGFNARQQTAWLEKGGGRELMAEIFADFGLIVFSAGNTGTQMGGWFKREIQTAADLRGLTMRIPALGGVVMERLGVNVQLLAGGDIFPALERGAIDATEWVGPFDDEKLGLHNAATFYYYPGWWEPGPSMSFMVNRQAYDALPSYYQEVLRTAAAEASLHTGATYDVENPPALERLLAAGVQLRRFSPEIMDAAHSASVAIMEENAAADATYRRVYEQWKQFRDASFRWFGTTEQAYATYAFPVIG